MSPTTAYVVPAATIVFLALISAPTSAVGTPDAGPDAAAEALPPARDLTIVQKIRADPDLSSCTTYPLRSMIADKSINEEFLQCSDVAVPDGDSVLFSDGEKDAVVPFCLANFFSFEVLCKAPPASVASANKGSAPLFKDTNLEFKPSLEFCNKLGSTLVQFDCEAVKQKVPGASVARCNAFNEARTTLLNNCPTVCAIGGINGFEAQCKHLFLTSVLVKNTMAELEATVGGHVKKGSANDAAKTKVIVAPPLVSSSTKKTAVLQKPDADGEELLHGNRIRRAINESMTVDESTEKPERVTKLTAPGSESEAINSTAGVRNMTKTGDEQTFESVDDRKNEFKRQQLQQNLTLPKTENDDSLEEGKMSQNNTESMAGDPKSEAEGGKPIAGEEPEDNHKNEFKRQQLQQNLTLQKTENDDSLEKGKMSQNNTESMAGDPKSEAAGGKPIAGEEPEDDNKNEFKRQQLQQNSALSKTKDDDSLEKGKMSKNNTDTRTLNLWESESAGGKPIADEEPNKNVTSTEKKLKQSGDQAAEIDTKNSTVTSPTTDIESAVNDVTEKLPLDKKGAGGNNATADEPHVADKTDDGQTADDAQREPVESTTANSTGDGADGKVVEQPEAIGRGDETKEENKKDDVGNADKGYEAEKPWRMPTEAPRSKEDQITNEGDAPGWRPPQAPRNPLPPQSPVFVDHLSKMGSGLDNQANYFSYFVVIAVLCIVFYLVFHNKQKILALILEGRKGRGNGRRRPSRTSAQYRKLDNHLEEAGGIDGNGADNAASVRNIIY